MTRGTSGIPECTIHLDKNDERYQLDARSDTNLHTVHNTKHRLLRTTAKTPSAEHHMQQHTICTPEDGRRDARNM